MLVVEFEPLALAASYPPKTRLPSICDVVSAPVKPQNTDHVLEAISRADNIVFNSVELRESPMALVAKTVFLFIPKVKSFKEKVALS